MKTLEQLIQEHTNRVIGAQKAYETKQKKLEAERLAEMKALNQTTLQQIYESYDDLKRSQEWD